MKKRQSIGEYFVGQKDAIVYPVSLKGCGFSSTGERLKGTITALFETNNFGFAVLQIGSTKRLVCLK